MSFLGGASLALGALGLVSSVRSGKAQEKAYDNAAANAERDAEYAKQFAEEEASEAFERVRRLMGEQRASISSSGLTMEGSIGDILDDTYRNVSVDAERIKNAGSIQALSLRQNAANSRLIGDASRNSGFYGGASSLVGGFSNAYTNDRQYGSGKLSGFLDGFFS